MSDPFALRVWSWWALCVGLHPTSSQEALFPVNQHGHFHHHQHTQLITNPSNKNQFDYPIVIVISSPSEDSTPGRSLTPSGMPNWCSNPNIDPTGSPATHPDQHHHRRLHLEFAFSLSLWASGSAQISSCVRRKVSRWHCPL